MEKNTTTANSQENPNSTDIDIDKIIEKLLEVKDKKPGKQVNLTEQEIKGLCIKSREIFMSQPILIELEAPIKICGKPSRASSFGILKNQNFPLLSALFFKKTSESKIFLLIRRYPRAVL